MSCRILEQSVCQLPHPGILSMPYLLIIIIIIIITVQSAIPKQQISIIVVPDMLYHLKHTPAAQDVFAPILCIIYESGVVRSLHIGSVCTCQSGQKVVVAIQLRPSEKQRFRFDKNNELAILNTLGADWCEAVIVLHAVIKNSHSPLLTSNI